jgi:hypothetical protein
MFLGHLAAGMAASRAEPRLPLGTAMLAAQLPDAVWPVLVLAGIERVAIAPGDTAVTPLRFDHYPWSHSLLAVAVWGAAVGALYAWRTGARRAGVFVTLLALSHWVLDVVSHRPDMPVVPGGGPRLGLGLWNSVAATVVVELALFALASWAWARGRKAGKGLWIFVGVLVLLYAGNLMGPPPPSTTAVALSAVILFPIVWFWGNRLEPRHRGSVPHAPGTA